MAAQFITIMQAAEIIGVSDQTLRRWIRTKKILLKSSRKGKTQGQPNLYSVGQIRKIASEYKKKKKFASSKR